MGKKIVISLFDYTGIMIKPWLDDGYECWIVDVQHPVAYETSGVTRDGNLVKHHYDLTTPYLFPGDKEQIAFVAAFPPCDHLAVSGSRWMKGKGLRKLEQSISMFATAAEFCEWSGAPYFLENPVSTISTYWRKPDYTFNPHDFTGICPGDNYTKKTCLWTGNGFVMPKPVRDESLGLPDDRIHKAPPGEERSNFRSATPMGFAKAVYASNRKRDEVEE